MSRGAGTDPWTEATGSSNYVRDQHYGTTVNLDARIALHAQHTVADTPWFQFYVDRMDWPAIGRLLEVGCGTGSLWQEGRPPVAELTTVVTDFSAAMVHAAAAKVHSFGYTPRPAQCNAAALAFPDASFDIVVANHMLYHVPEPAAAVAEFRRVLKPDGQLIAATSGRSHMRQLLALSNEVLGTTSPTRAVTDHFGLHNGAALLRQVFERVESSTHVAHLEVPDPEALVAYIVSFPPGDESTAEQREELRQVARQRILEAGGRFRVDKEQGFFVCQGFAA